MASGTSRRDQERNARAAQKAGENLAEVLRGIGVGGKLGLRDVGISVVRRVKELLSTPGTGEIYLRGTPGKGKAHVASSPGDPPAVDEGRLRSSYTYQTGEEAGDPYVDVGTNVEYAPFLEFGTVKMEPRPHLRPAVDSLRREIQDKIRDGIIREEKDVVRRLPPEIS